MEMSPAIACANRCVFCWRHHTHPTSKEWKWKVDDPKFIVDEAIKKHQEMIKSLKGVPGVTLERLKEAMTVKHTALSLIGEPITYPRINEMTEYLHEKNISTFLVTNPQFPVALENLKLVTQLYVSIDAPTQLEWKKVTRPVFEDYWERFLKCLDIVKSKKNLRTVYRLTLVKSWNMEEIDQYAKLVERGNPCFIEIKGVTYCGNQDGELTMENVPFHQEVKLFSEKLSKAVKGYQLCSEHEHSCLVLLCQDQFKINDKFYTWIDYPKFFELVRSGKEFYPLDFAQETPSWAYYNSKEQGFDPNETRDKVRICEKEKNIIMK